MLDIKSPSRNCTAIRVRVHARTRVLRNVTIIDSDSSSIAHSDIAR
jgi:hypothetical protein